MVAPARCNRRIVNFLDFGECLSKLLNMVIQPRSHQKHGSDHHENRTMSSQCNLHCQFAPVWVHNWCRSKKACTMIIVPLAIMHNEWVNLLCLACAAVPLLSNGLSVGYHAQESATGRGGGAVWRSLRVVEVSS